ncbi:hypothetical protein X801_02428 [Opisthorchis viverrini]|uniref:Uncharacterized protein n=1 Tax=Opisthorchis viverrini TaxID=6198 RepID=A0A1S8X4M7_OPIVI|nr:hypothetical protein X801_02428 [Opisthorchis viverrini]
MDVGQHLSTTHPNFRESVEVDGSPSNLGTSENTRGVDDEAHRISSLEIAIEKVTAERDQLKATLREQQRAVEALESCIIAKTDTKEKELRHFLAPRPILSDSESPPVQQPVSTIAPILSTVPAVRPVPTLIGGTTKCADGLLGPAHLPSTGPSATHTGTTNLSSRSDSRKLTNGPSALSNESDGGVPLYSKVFIDSCVNLVLARLRRAQNNCHALVATSQTDLQSFTFTQNSQNGKRIMMRVRVLEQENEELANVHMEYLVEEVENETEFIGNSLLVLQHRLNLARATAQVLAAELETVVPGKALELLQQANWFPFEEASPGDEQSLCGVATEFDDYDDKHHSCDAVQSTHVETSCRGQSPNHSVDEPSVSAVDSVHELTNHSAKRRKDSFSGNTDCNHIVSDSPEAHLLPTKRSRTLEHQMTTPHAQSHLSPENRPTIPVDGPQRTFTSSHDCDAAKEAYSLRTSELCVDSAAPSSPSATTLNRNQHSCPMSSVPSPRKHSKQSLSDPLHDTDVPSNGRTAGVRDLA